ncbi:MAG TPA: hypothetical protein VFY73_26565 [Ideonella sp.]|uniref:hypothetical protein n=1 Tax=Ideonella sp. TaxID=1929293 RepID=UPI002E342D4B|nr:hypothetical protein [Ideonella sp.]HEX5687593.1 hypothetical protein [Ideonella sp.]
MHIPDDLSAWRHQAWFPGVKTPGIAGCFAQAIRRIVRAKLDRQPGDRFAQAIRKSF